MLSETTLSRSRARHNAQRRLLAKSRHAHATDRIKHHARLLSEAERVMRQQQIAERREEAKEQVKQASVTARKPGMIDKIKGFFRPRNMG